MNSEAGVTPNEPESNFKCRLMQIEKPKPRVKNMKGMHEALTLKGADEIRS